MDYTILYNYIAETGQITNMNEGFALYYDETNNLRTFKLTDDGFNYDERAFFVLGGMAFIKGAEPSKEEIEELFIELQLQSSAVEIKFKHIQQKSKDFLELLSKPKVKTFLNWLYHKQYAIHYSYIDNFYYTIVDIVDSMEESAYGGFELNRSLKDSLYSLIKEHQDWFVHLLIEVDYPNVKNHKRFVEELADWISTVNIEDDFNLEYLRQSLKSYRKKQLVFLEDNEDRIAIPDYSGFYSNAIITFPNSLHIFDHELRVEALISDNPIELFGAKVGNYKFVDSKDCYLIQISDLVVGILRMWMSFLEMNDIMSLYQTYNSIQSEIKPVITQFQQILINSLEVSTGFKHGIASNDFELKINSFLEYNFS
jgi:hypothetical protein